MMAIALLIVIVLVCAWLHFDDSADTSEQMHGVKCTDKAIAGGTGYRASCSRGRYVPTTYHVDTKWNSDVNSSKNMNYSHAYWNGIKLASCDECPNPYACIHCPKYRGAGMGYFDDPNKIRGLNEEINIGVDEAAVGVNSEFFTGNGYTYVSDVSDTVPSFTCTTGETFGDPIVSPPIIPVFADGSPMVPPKQPITNIGVLASNAYEISKLARQLRDNMTNDRVALPFDLVSPAPMRFTPDRVALPFNLVSPAPMGSMGSTTEHMSISGHNEVYHGHHGQFIGEDMCGEPACAEDLYYMYTQNYAADSISDISRELHSRAVAKPRSCGTMRALAAEPDTSRMSDAAGLSLRKHASTAGCRRSTATTAAKLLYTGVLGLENANASPDLGQCEYLRPNGYVYQEPC